MEIKYLDEIEDHIKKEFLIEKYIGKGSYGIVWRVKDLKTQKKYALKKIFRAFRNCTDAKRTVREVSFLSQLSNHDNIIKLEKVIKSQNQTDLYLVFEYVESDLHKVIQQKILLPIHQKYIIYQILLVLQYLHSGELIHRDLKPANLLLKKSCIIKLADFGLARCVQDLDETIPVYTEYAATRSYQAPEILFGSQNYSYAVDMWSVGCILFEMLTGQVMYNKEAIYDQIQSIFEFLGTPDDQDIESFKLKNPENLRFQTQLFQTKQTFRMHQILDAYDPKAKDFIKNCMKYNPQQRMTAQQALEHPYVQEFKGHFKQKLSDFKFISLKNDEQLYSVKEYQDILDKFIQFRDGDIQEFKRQNNQKLLTQSNNRTIIQSPIKTFSKNDKITQEHLQTQQNKFGPRIQPENKQFEKNITLQEFQSCDAIDSLCENKKQQFHQPRVSNDTKKMSLKYQLNQRKNSQEFFEWARRLSLQTNCSQFSISENQGSLIKQSAKHYSIYFNHQILSKQFSHIWNIDQIRNFCDHYKLEWAKEILRIHYQIIKLKIWSFILNIYEANRLQLKRLQGLHRSKICTRGKCCRCSGPEGKCTCELLWELLQQITCYIKHIFMAEKLLNIQEIMISTLNEIQSNYYLLIYQYLPKEQVIVLLKIIKLDCLDQLFKQNLIDGFVISVFRKCPFTETNQLLKLFDFNLQYNKNLKMLDFKLIPKLLNFKNIHLVKMCFQHYFTQPIHQNQTIYNCQKQINFKQRVNKLVILMIMIYSILMQNVQKCGRNLWIKKLKPQMIWKLLKFSIQKMVVMNPSPQMLSDQILQKFTLEIGSDLLELEQKSQNISTGTDKCITNETVTTETTPLIDSSKNLADQQQTMQESIYLTQKYKLQESVYLQIPQQQQMLESLQFSQQDNKPIQEPVYFSQTKDQLQQMQESVMFPQKDYIQMQESVYFIPPKQQMQESVYFPQQYKQEQKLQGFVYISNQMQGSVVFIEHQNQQMQESVMLQDPKNNNFGQSEMVGQSVMMGLSKFTNNNNNINNPNIKKPNIKNNYQDPLVKLKVSFQEQDDKKKGEIQNRTPTRQKRIKLISSIEQSSLHSVINNQFILNISHQMKIKSEQFHKILLINLIGATFGRNQDNQYVLQDQSKISSKHARIKIVNDRFSFVGFRMQKRDISKCQQNENKIGYGISYWRQKLMTKMEVQHLYLTRNQQIRNKLIQKLVKLGVQEEIQRELIINLQDIQFINYYHKFIAQLLMFQKDGELKFIIDDQNSKNGTWLRLSDKKLLSEPQLLLRNSKFNLAFEIQYEVIDVYYQNNQ
ncbi:unnamed protein product [Paramecium pentaurelia]|uniref:Mitogen-activated protein kinase n=1 Tax=Paramecium pentaurelia TaxID=43138 RepID=A0A8S1XH07_9CILI|nr:unnamed protein product [Paramecium pentaurelia]